MSSRCSRSRASPSVTRSARSSSRSLSGAPPLGVVVASLVLTAVVYAPLAAFRWPTSMPSAHVVESVLGLAIVCTALAFILFFALIGEVGPVRATVITYVNPAVAAIVGVLLLDERLTTGMIVGFVLVLAGTVIATGRGPELVPETSKGEASRGGRRSCASASGFRADPSPSRPARWSPTRAGFLSGRASPRHSRPRGRPPSAFVEEWSEVLLRAIVTSPVISLSGVSGPRDRTRSCGVSLGPLTS